MLKQNLERVFSEIAGGNDRGEKITLVGATKTVDADTINRAVSYGLNAVAENKVREFNEKFPLVKGADRQFIGHLQTNKVKLVVGKASLIQSTDTIHLAEAIDKQAEKINTLQKILVEVNVGGELTKSGFGIDEARDAVRKIAEYKHLSVIGLMAMLPKSEDENLLADLCEKMRGVYDRLIAEGYPLSVLSMGMSGDYRITIKHGSNMIRLGRTIFGERNYGETNNGSI